MSEKEIRTYGGLQIRAAITDGGVKHLEGYAAKFNSLSNILGDGFKERIRPTAFTRALKEGADVRMLKNHDANYVLGRTKSGTLRLSLDTVGLRFICDLPDTQYARDLHESIKRGDMDQCSFAFKALKDSWSEEFDEDSQRNVPVRELHDVDLFDVSAVVYPAYENTSVAARNLAVRSNPPKRNVSTEELGLLVNALALGDEIQRDKDRVQREIEARYARFDEKSFSELKTVLAQLERPWLHFRSIQDMQRAQKRLQELLAAA